MNLIPLRTAAIAGTCVVALSFISLPAFAVDAPVTDPGTTQPTDEPTVAPTDDSTTAPTDDSTAGADDGSEVGDDNGSDSTDDDGDASPVATLPAEKRTPKQHFAQTVFTPKEIAKKGIKVEYTGLTAGKEYQLFESTGQSGGPLADAKKASNKGTLKFTYRFSRSERSFAALGAVYTIGLDGIDTDLRLTQEIAVKYDSDLTWNTAERHGKKVTLSVSVDKDDAAGESSDWKKVAVAFQKKVRTTWVTVKTVKTNKKGTAKLTLKAGVSTWRAVLAGSTTVIGATSGGHRK